MPALQRLFLSSFGIVLVGTFCAFITHLTLAKLLSVSEYGIFNFILAISLLLSILSLFGFQNSLVKLIPVINARREGDHNAVIKSLTRFSTIFSMLLALFSSALVYGGLYLFNIADQYPVEALVIGFFLTPLMVFLRLQSSILRGFNKTKISIFYETTSRELLFLISILVAILIGVQLDLAFQVLLLFLSVLFVVSIVSYLHTRKNFIKKINNPASDEQKKEWLKLSFPMMLVIFAQRLMRRSDIIIIGLMLNPAVVGVYAIAAQFSEVSAISQKVVQSVFSSRAAELHEKKNVVELKQLYRQNLIFSSVSTAALCLVIAFIFPYVLAFLGEDFKGAFNALLILMIGHFIMVCTGPAAALLAMTGYEKTIMWITFAAALGNIILNIPMIYFYGIEGAAFVTAFFMVLRNIVSYIYVRHYHLLKEYSA